MKILVFGAAGMIGHRIWMEANNTSGTQVFGVVRKSSEYYRNFQIFNENVFYETDVSHWENAEKVLNKVQPQFIVNAIGITIRKPEIQNLEKALEVNSFFPHRLLKWAQAHQSKVIHLSTDCVFDGGLGQYTELSQPTAKDHYGKTKFLGEIDGVSALTLRFSCIGRELESKTELLEWFLAQDRKEVKGFGKAIYSGVTTKVVAREVMRVITHFPELCGVFQLSSLPISKYDLLCLIQKVYGTSTSIARSDDYVSDKTLICSRFSEQTGYRSQSWEAMIDELKNDKQVQY